MNDITTWVSVLIIEPNTRWGGLACEYNVHLVMSGHCKCCYNDSFNSLALELNAWCDMQQAMIGRQLYLSFIILGTTLHCTFA